jgi:hypothetical protein
MISCLCKDCIYTSKAGTSIFSIPGCVDINVLRAIRVILLCSTCNTCAYLGGVKILGLPGAKLHVYYSIYKYHWYEVASQSSVVCAPPYADVSNRKEAFGIGHSRVETSHLFENFKDELERWSC